MSPKMKEEGGPAAGSKRKINDKDSVDYKKKRDRNNIAVKKSREKSRAKARETQEKVARLKKENEDLEMKVQLLSKELSVLKDLFLAHASGVASQPDSCLGPHDIIKVKEEETEETKEPHFAVGSPVNQEGFNNDHEYFGLKHAPVAAK